MSYRPKESGMIRDKTYPSEIAAKRPFGAPRIQCEESQFEAEDASILGESDESVVERFNRQLRGGAHGDR